MSVYTDNGYESRKDYLECLSEDYNVPLEMVCQLAQMLGSTEDFDGLVSALKDAEGYIQLGMLRDWNGTNIKRRVNI